MCSLQHLTFFTEHDGFEILHVIAGNRSLLLFVAGGGPLYGYPADGLPSHLRMGLWIVSSF